MNAREMHYDFKDKFNKIDSQKNRNLIVPEIDWKLNEAQEVFCKIIAQPRIANKLIGFEINQRTIDDIRTVVIDQKPTDYITTVPYDDSSFTAPLPANYWFFSKGYVIATKGECTNKKLKAREVQHDDDHESSTFDKSSFKWRVANINFNSEGIRIFTGGDFTPTKLALEYLKRPRLIHNAQDYINGTYDTLSGLTLTGSQPCELPEGVHGEVVDLAVLLAAFNVSASDILYKQSKIKLTE